MTPENMDAEDVFLSCSNLTLGQYKVIVLTRGVVGAAGCVVSLAVLGIVLLTTKKKSWENLTKRIYLAIILYTFLYFIVTIAAVNYSHPPSQESAWCETMGFLLHYTGTLVVVQYCALAFAIMLQIVRFLRNSNNSIGPKKVKPGEVLLYLILFLCPMVTEDILITSTIPTPIEQRDASYFNRHKNAINDLKHDRAYPIYAIVLIVELSNSTILLLS